ncbi:MAG: hypothetical protein WBE34_18495 [Candidatus Nitrosopolaris sp.]
MNLKSLTLRETIINSASVKIFNQIDTTPEEIGQIAIAISDRINRDKNAVCLLLYFCNILIQDWYNEIIHKFNPLLVKEAAASKRKLTALEVAPLTEFIKRRYYEPLAKNLENLLKKVLERFDKGELHDILDREKITDILRIEDNLIYFRAVAVGQKNEWHQSLIKNRSLDVEAQVIEDWKNDLVTISERVNKVELRLGDSLGCQEHQTSELFRQYREQRRHHWYSLWRRP